jgi:hypothetical protein
MGTAFFSKLHRLRVSQFSCSYICRSSRPVTVVKIQIGGGFSTLVDRLYVVVLGLMKWPFN